MTLPNNDALAKLLTKADPAPWTIRTLENFGFNVVHYRNGDKFDILRVAKCSQDDNAMLIALAPDLAAEVLALRKRVEAADTMVEAVDHERNLATQDIGRQIDATNAVDAALAAYRATGDA
ncbi:hypothetical protein [Loktanella sp. R86503]|uniref:hypothetical protein n=1 Tax=Loktanella sp. R86503 TaxID=3093847 RepID=UPI0036DE54F9